jgi:hypothetical protein
MPEYPKIVKKKVVEDGKVNGKPLTLHQLLQNPSGWGTAFLARRDEIKANLEARYYKILKKHATDIKLVIYTIGKQYLFHFEFPSESLEKIIYDVCLLFIPNDADDEKSRTLSNYQLKMFSNNPASTFFYTYVLNNGGLLIDFLKAKCSDIALKKPPKIRNPVETMGFDKSIYFSCLYIREHRLYEKTNINRYNKKWDKKSFLKNIKDQETMIKEREIEKKKQEEKKKKEKKNEIIKKNNKKINEENQKKLDERNNKGVKPGTKSGIKKATKSATKSATKKGL